VGRTEPGEDVGKEVEKAIGYEFNYDEKIKAPVKANDTFLITSIIKILNPASGGTG
jgi:hypothetical protein